MITGHGQYVDDLNKPGTVHVAFVRSQTARGRITGLDVTEARQVPGVIAVLTAAEINPRTTVGGSATDQTPRRLLCDGDVRYVGDLIAMVVAESRYLAEDAAELVSVDIEPDDPVVTAAQALAEGSPLVHRELPSNVSSMLPPGQRPSWTGCWTARRTCSTRRSPSTGTCACRWRPAAWSPVGRRRQAAGYRPGLPGRA